MTTKRVPINRPARGRITPAALDLFSEMQSLECTCKVRWPAKGYDRCPGCKRWWNLHSEFFDSLVPHPKPWQFPCVLNIRGEGDEDAARLTAELEAALAERREV
jgi:hypothetical protein